MTDRLTVRLNVNARAEWYEEMRERCVEWRASHGMFGPPSQADVFDFMRLEMRRLEALAESVQQSSTKFNKVQQSSTVLNNVELDNPSPAYESAHTRSSSSSSKNIEEEEEIAAQDAGDVEAMASRVVELWNSLDAVQKWGMLKQARGVARRKLMAAMRANPDSGLAEWLDGVRAAARLQRSQLQYTGTSLTEMCRNSRSHGVPVLLVAHCYEAKDQPNPPTVADVAADESVKVTWSQVPASGRVAETSEHKQRYCTVMQREAPAVYWGLYEAAKTRAEMYYRRGFRGQRLVTAVADRGTWDVWRKWRGVIAPIVARAIEEVENGAQADEGGRDSGDADAAAGDAADGRPDAMEAHGAGGEGDGAGGGRHLLGGVDVADAAHHGGGAEAKADIRDFRAHVRGFLENR